MRIKLRKNNLNINAQEFKELVADYKSGTSLKELAKRYGCSGPGLKEFLQKKGVDLREKYSLLKDEERQKDLVKDYMDGTKNTDELLQKYHCQWNTFKKVLSSHGIDISKKHKHFTLDLEARL